MTRFLATLCACLLLSFAARAADTIKLGIGYPMSGEVASLGADVRAGFDLALEDINAKGGPAGRKIEAQFEDDVCDPKTGVIVAGRFIAAKKDAVIHICSTVCMAAGPLYAEENIPFFNMCNADGITAQGFGNVARAWMSNMRVGGALAALAAKHLPKKKLAVLYAADAYSRNLGEDMIAVLDKEYGVKPDFTLRLAGQEQDFSSIITQLKDGGIETVYLGFWPKGIGMFLRQADAAGYRPQFLSNDVANGDEIIKIGGAGSDGLIFTMPPDPKDFPEAADVMKALAAKGFAGRPYAVYSYMIAQIYAQAVEKAGSAAPDAVMKAVKGNAFDTVAGKVSFTPNGDMTGLEMQYFQWRGGKYAPWKP
ncbi:MAG: branched-chain amino acid ABC transporter substrate-binding protein [Alphaproteobacteria bacterium]